jgi:prevent-host-death family protein
VDVNVGVKEFRDSLSKHLANVRTGGTVTVTDHGRPVARLVPVGIPSKLEQLIADGRVTSARRSKHSAERPVEIDSSVSDLVSDQRR